MRYNAICKILLVLAVITASIPLALAEGESINLGSYSVAPGSTVDVPITIENANLVAGGVVKITYDSTIVNVTSVSSGDFGIPIANTNIAGVVTLSAAGTTAIGTSSAVLGTLTFEGISSGTSTLAFQAYSNSYLNLEDGSLVEASLSDGSITVTGVSGGTDTVGVYQISTGTFFLINSIVPGPADETAQYGPGGDDFLPMVGDWDGDGIDTDGVYQISTGTFFLKNSITPGPADETAQYGPGGDDFLPMVGDWDGDGTDTIGVYQISTGTFFLINSIVPGPADETAQYGPGGSDYLPMVGDWDNDGTDTIGVYQTTTGTFFLINSIVPGPADETAQYGPGGSDFLPMVGDWDGL